MYGTYTNSHFWTDLNQTLHTSPPWSGRDYMVCMDPKFLTSSTFSVLFLWGPLQNHGHKMAADMTVFRNNLISVILVGVLLRSRKWRCVRRQSHPPVSYPLFQWVFASRRVTSRHSYYVQPDDGAIRHSVISLISLIPAGVRVMSRTLCSTGRRGHPPQRYIPHSSFCFCDLQETTSLQTTVARSYSKCQ
jgi:hypothetical protein